MNRFFFLVKVGVGKEESEGPIGDFNENGAEIRQSPLLQIAWQRVILDEAHTIRNNKALVSQAVCRLRAARRWAVTGTPVQNKEMDMYSLLRYSLELAFLYLIPLFVVVIVELDFSAFHRSISWPSGNVGSRRRTMLRVLRE